MSVRPSYRIVGAFAAALATACIVAGVTACSTTRVLLPGEKSLVGNTVTVDGEKNFNVASLTPYLKQNGSGWTPFKCVYNWENGKGGSWDRFVHKLGTPPVVFDSTQVDASVRNIADHLTYMGYYGSKVSASVQERGARKVRVKYNVTLGRRYPLERIRYSVPMDSDFGVEFFADTANNSLKPGSFLSESALEAESARGAYAMRNKGYYDFSKNYYFFRADTVSHRGFAKLDVVIEKHTRNETELQDRVQNKYKFGLIRINYPQNLKFREKVLRDLNNLQAGRNFSESAVAVAYSRFNSVALFNSVNIKLSPRPDENVVDCDINIRNGKIQGFKLGLEASVNSSGLFGISPELSYYNRNIFHGGELLTIGVSTNHQVQFGDSSVHSDEVSASASLSLPRFVPFSTRFFRGPVIPKSVFTLAYNFQSRPEYKRNIFSMSFGYTGRFRQDRHILYDFKPISWQILNLPYVTEEFLSRIQNNSYLMNSYQDHLDMGSSAVLYYSSVNSPNPDRTYWYDRLQVDLAGNILSLFYPLMRQNDQGRGLLFNIPFAQYVRIENSIGRTWFWGRNNARSLAVRFLAGLGLAYGNSLTLPFEKQFFSGGASSLRGWTARTVGPGNSPLNTSWTIPNQTGDMKLEANAEFRFKILWKIAGAVFAECGNVWNLPHDGVSSDSVFSFSSLGQSLAADWGAGLRLDMSFMILRLDLGMRIHDPAAAAGERWVAPARWLTKGNYALHFGVGYPF